MKETIELLTQVAIAVPGIVALIIAWKALKISQNAQRNTIRESVFQWQFEAVREICLKLNVYLHAYHEYEIDKEINKEDFNNNGGLETLTPLFLDLQNTADKYEFILPRSIYDAIDRLVEVYDNELSNLFEGKPVQGYFKLLELSFSLTNQFHSMFGIPELSLENMKLIKEFRKENSKKKSRSPKPSVS
jgi:hypothetical protein